MLDITNLFVADAPLKKKNNNFTPYQDPKTRAQGKIPFNQSANQMQTLINHLLQQTILTKIMVLILDGNSEIGAHVRSNLCYFT